MQPTLDVLSRLARPGSPLHRILARRLSTLPGASFRGMGGGGSSSVLRGDPQMGGFPSGGLPHLSPTVKLSPGTTFGSAGRSVNGYDAGPISRPNAVGSKAF